MACPALNSQGEPCAFQWPRPTGWCPYHDPVDRRLPGAVELRRGRKRRAPPQVVELPVWDPDYLPSLRRELGVVRKVREWAAEFDGMDEQQYSALQFVEWLELELAPPAKAKDEVNVVYGPPVPQERHLRAMALG